MYVFVAIIVCYITDREVDLIKMKNLLNILSDSSKRFA